MLQSYYPVGMAKLVDALALGASGETHGSSSLPPDTKQNIKNNPAVAGLFFVVFDFYFFGFDFFGLRKLYCQNAIFQSGE